MPKDFAIQIRQDDLEIFSIHDYVVGICDNVILYYNLSRKRETSAGSFPMYKNGLRFLSRKGVPSRMERRDLRSYAAHTGDRPITILGISGSLRRASYNTGLLRAAAKQLPEGTKLEIADIGNLPVFNDDLTKGCFAGRPKNKALCRRRNACSV